MRKPIIYFLHVSSYFINSALRGLIKTKNLTKKVLIVTLLLMSCKSAENNRDIKVTTTYKQNAEANVKPTVEISVGPDIEIQDVELHDFKEFEVWVTTKYRDTIGNCRLKKVHNLKGIDSLSHFFVRFKTLPIVYKMKIENEALVFAKINRKKTN